MKKNRYLLLIACLVFAGLLASCSKTTGPVVDILQVEGVSWACNVNTSYAIFGSSSESEEHLKLTLPASPGDLLYMIKDDLQFYYRYNSEDGPVFSVRFDTLGAVSVYLNGNLEYMELSGAASLEAFGQLGDPELATLSTLYLEGPFSNDQLRILKRHESVIAGKGLVVEGDPGSGHFYEILSICQPGFLVINDLDEIPDTNEGECVANVELLWVDSNIPELASLTSCCNNLESLILADWKPEPGELLPLSGLKKLQSITLAESKLTSLASIEFPESLRRLYMIGCDTLSDISGLAGLDKIKHLGLAECSQLQNLDESLFTQSLQWLSFPPGISQQEFVKVTERCTDLEVTELIACNRIEDLSPLQNLPGLGILVLQLEREQLGGLDSLRQLKLLVLTNEVFDDYPEWIKELRKSLPATTIVPGSGLCLGSGWLLLLIPMILVFRFAVRRKYGAHASA